MKKINLFIVLVSLFINFEAPAQNWTQIIKACANDRSELSYYGYSVDIYGDYAVVGSPYDKYAEEGSSPYTNAGSAYILKKINNEWVEIQKIYANDRASNDRFGNSVAIWGNYIVVGAEAKIFAPLVNVGAVYIFEKIDDTWQFKQKLNMPDPKIYSSFGCSVAVENDNIIVGAYSKYLINMVGDTMYNVGAAYTFKNINNTWTFKQTIIPNDYVSGDYFGYSVALSGDYFIAGSYGHGYDSNGANLKFDAGAVYVYKNIADSWVQTQKIVADDRQEDNFFGYSLDIQNDYMVVGAVFDKRDSEGNNIYDNSGSAYVFKNNSGTWIQVKKLLAPFQVSYDEFGSDVSIYDDNIAISSFKHDYDLNNENLIFNSGAVYMFKNVSNDWILAQKIVPNERYSSDQFGKSISIFENDILIGVNMHDYNANGEESMESAGATYFFYNTSEMQVFKNEIYIANGETFDFGEVLYGESGTVVEFKITNSGGSALTLTNNPIIELIDNSNSFVLNQSSTNNFLMPSDDTYFTIQFIPTFYGNFSAQLIIENDQFFNNPYIINITGIGGKNAQNITNFDNLDEKTYGDANFQISASASSGLSVVFSSSDPNIASCNGENGSIISIHNAGECQIFANQIGDYAYYPATQVARTLTVNKKSINVSAEENNKYFGNSDPELSYSFSPQLIGSDSFSGQLTRESGENVGLYTINQGSLSLSNNYNLIYNSNSFEILKRPITVIASAGQTKVYTGPDPTPFTYTYSGGLIGNDHFTGFLNREVGEEVGEYNILQNNLTLTNNYQINFVSDVFTITPKQITITATSGQGKSYGQDDPAIYYYTLSEILNYGNSLSGYLTREPGENVGEYAINIGTLSITPNYTFIYQPSNFIITPKSIDVKANLNQSKFYGDTDPELSYYTVGSLLSGDSFTGALSRTQGENVGLYAINLGDLSAGSNYSINFTSQNFEIKTKTIAIFPDDGQFKIYGNPDPVFTFTCDPPIASWDSFAGALSREVGEIPGTYLFTIGSLALNSNYNIWFMTQNIEFTILQRDIVVTINPNQHKTYGQPDPVLTYTYSGELVGYDTFSGFLTRQAGENVGQYQIYYNNLQINANYNISYVGNTFEILQKEITVIADAASKTYGYSDPYELTYSASSELCFYDSFVGNLIRQAGNNVGIYEITQGSLALSSNYILYYIPADFEILPRNITVKANEGQSKLYGEADPPQYTYTIILGSTMYGDHFSGQLGREPGENAGEYPIVKNSLSLGTNYNIIFQSTMFNIFPRNLTIVVDQGQSKIYGEEDPEFTYSVQGQGAGMATFSGQLERDPGENVGQYAINIGSLEAGINFSFNFSPANFKILKASPELYWENPDDIFTNQALSETQLNASANTGGSFEYNPNFGTYLQEGENQELHVLFTPNDNLNYNQAEKTVFINVLLWTGITEDADIELLTYPNPTDGLIYFKIENLENFNLRVFDSSLKLIFENFMTQNYFDLSNFETGIYIIEIKTNNKVYRNKIVLL